MENLNLDIQEIPGDAFINEGLLPTSAKLAASGAIDFGIKLPYVIKNAILMSPGTWNNYYYTGEVIKKAHVNTNWKDKTVRNLYLDHEEGTSEWVGYVSNPRCVNGTEYGDLYIYDPITAVKLAKGKPKFGISPRVRGRAEDGIMKEFVFENFSFVINPAVKTTYINNMEVKTMDFKLQEEGESEVETPAEEATEEETAEEAAEKASEEAKEEATEEKVEEELTKKPEKEEKMAKKKKKKPEEEEMAKKKKKDYGYPKEELSEWTDKIKKWLKAHPGKSVKDAIEALKKQMEEQEMAEREAKFQALLEEMLEIMRKRTKRYEPQEKYPYKYPYKKKLEEMQEELSEKNKTIEELKEKVMKLEEKLNEPASKVTVKAEPETVVFNEYSDENFMKYLRDEVQGGTVKVE
ncbi:MAG: hypothetical protein ACTSXO_04660 [Candidatus Heimdallarchaeota archaeon]